jgi:DNA polymerase-1
LGNIIFGYYGLPVLEETERGEPSLTDSVLQRYHKEHGNSVAMLVSKYRKLNKALSDFVEKLDYLSGYDSRLHGNIHLNGAKTGRTSSSDPNLQNITERVVITETDDTKSEYVIKKIITASPINDPSNPGWSKGLPREYFMDKYRWQDGEKLVVVDADLSGAEVKVMTRFAPDPGLIQALTDGFDAHSWITSEIHGIPYEDVQTKRKLDTEEGKRLDNLRGGTKAVVFKILYGGEPEDQALKELIFRRFPGIPKYLEEVRRAVHREGKIFTPNGRARRFPLVKVDRWVASRNERQAINYNIQSYCSDIVLNMLVNLASNMHEIRGRLMLTVHDSVVFECPESEVSKLPDFLQRHITDHIASEFPDIPVPMTFGYKLGWNYGEMYSIKDWLSMSKD